MKVQIHLKVLYFCSANALASSPPPPPLRWRRIGRFGYSLSVFHDEHWVSLHDSHQIGAGDLCRLAEQEYRDWLESWAPTASGSTWTVRAKLRKGPKNPSLQVYLSEVANGA